MSEIVYYYKGLSNFWLFSSWVIELAGCWARFSQQQVLPAGFPRHPDSTEQTRDLLKICFPVNFIVFVGFLARQNKCQQKILLYCGYFKEKIKTPIKSVLSWFAGDLLQLNFFWIDCIHSAQYNSVTSVPLNHCNIIIQFQGNSHNACNSHEEKIIIWHSVPTSIGVLV